MRLELFKGDSGTDVRHHVAGIYVLYEVEGGGIYQQAFTLLQAVRQVAGADAENVELLGRCQLHDLRASSTSLGFTHQFGGLAPASR